MKDRNVTQTEKKKLFVHIGMHKTGTSSIQYAMHQNYAELMRGGYLYPMSARHPVSYVQHDMIYRALARPAESQDMFSLAGTVEADVLFPTLLQEIELSACNNIVLSAENLWRLEEAEVADLARWFARFDITPVLFIRRFSDFVESLHLTRIRIDPSYAQMFRKSQEFYRGYMDLDIETCVKNWASIASDGRVLLHSYDNEQKNSILSFMELIGAGDIKIRSSDLRVNESQPYLEEAIRTTCGRFDLSDDVFNGLKKQLSVLQFREKHTLIPAAIRRELDQSYFDQVKRLLDSDIVRTSDLAKWRMERDEEPVELNGALSILLAVGRALA